jgi:hypothetical protein
MRGSGWARERELAVTALAAESVRLSRVGRGAARVVLVGYCVVTALYAFVASSAFAYLQFIKPRVFRWVGTFADSHVLLSWIWLALLAAFLVPMLRRERGLARPAAGLAICALILVAVNASRSVVAGLTDGPASVVAGILALAPALWMAALDHLAGWDHLRTQRGPPGEPDHEQQDGRLLGASLGTAVLVTGSYAVLASISIAGAFEPDLLTRGLAAGVVASLIGNMLVFGAVFAVAATLCRLGGASVRRQYFLLLAALVLLFSGILAHIVGDSIGLPAASRTIVSIALGATTALTWGGSRLAAHARRGTMVTSGMDVLFSPPAAMLDRRAVLPVVAVVPLAWLFARIASNIDWDFALLRSGVVIVWVLTFALVYRAAPRRRVGIMVTAAPWVIAMLAHALWQPNASGLHARERYAVYNPSFLVTDALLRERPASRSFDRFLRANTGLTDVSVAPVPIDFVGPPIPAAPVRPDIFLLVVDSLRADYLSPYNPAVSFTPRMAQFAAENAFFPNAFTRYGGTGLSMPAIWAGSALVHKQYVTPFREMNALEKLVDANGYRRIQSHDHITEALWSGTAADTELDRGRTEMDFSFCRTTEELGDILARRSGDRRPVFAQTRSLDLHVAAVRNGYVPPDRSYPGFEPPYAYRVERIDTCFGAFVDRLKQLGVYDRSIVVLTADHGELIGEDGRWGHSYHLFPQVSQVPLLVHLPPGAAPFADRGALTLSTDITPTIYAALGYDPVPPTALAGHSLMDRDAAAARRGGHAVLSASYGAVYAVVSRNGRRLYIADAIHEQEHAYARDSVHDLAWRETDVSPGQRVLEQLRIRRYVDELARTYALDRPF